MPPRISRHEITPDYVKTLLSYDPENHEFRWRVNGKGRKKGSIAGLTGSILFGHTYFSKRVLARLFGYHIPRKTTKQPFPKPTLLPPGSKLTIPEKRPQRAISRKAEQDAITPERVKELLTYDPETNVFRWLVGGKGREKSRIAAPAYPLICIDGVIFTKRQAAIKLGYDVPLKPTGQKPKSTALVVFDHALTPKVFNPVVRLKRPPAPCQRILRPKVQAPKKQQSPIKPETTKTIETVAAELQALGVPEHNIAKHLEGLKQAAFAKAHWRPRHRDIELDDEHDEHDDEHDEQEEHSDHAEV